MENESWLMLGILIIGLISLIGFFVTKTKGFGRFATSTLLIILVFIISSLMFSAGKFDAQVMANIIFSVIGFAGGLFTGKEKSNNNSKKKPNRVRASFSPALPSPPCVRLRTGRFISHLDNGTSPTVL